MLALMIATCILPHIESVAIIPGTNEYSTNDGTQDRLKNYIEMAWFFSTTIGIFLFLVDIDLICWVKFWNYGAHSGTNVGMIASISVTIALIPIFAIFIIFAIDFYRNLVTHQFEKSEREILELDSLINQLNCQHELSSVGQANLDTVTICSGRGINSGRGSLAVMGTGSSGTGVSPSSNN